MGVGVERKGGGGCRGGERGEGWIEGEGVGVGVERKGEGWVQGWREG